MHVVVPQILLYAYILMVSLLWIVHILLCKLQGIESTAIYFNIIKDSFLLADLVSFCTPNFSRMFNYSSMSSGKNIMFI
jgi:hypothetical protein